MTGSVVEFPLKNLLLDFPLKGWECFSKISDPKVTWVLLQIPTKLEAMALFPKQKWVFYF